MSNDTAWSLLLAPPFDRESPVVAVRLPDVADELALQVTGGAWNGRLPGRPSALRLAPELAGRASEAAASPTSPTDAAATVEALMGDGGVSLPAADAVRLTVGWRKACHTGGPASRDERWGSREHMDCAALVAEVEGLGLLPSTRLTVGDAGLTFGQVIALAGDYYAHLDAEAARDFADAWPASSFFTDLLSGTDYRATTLGGDVGAHVEALATLLAKEEDVAAVLAEVERLVDPAHPSGRYLALASQNVCHFGHPRDEARNEALQLYRRYHARALELARKASVVDAEDASFQRALVVDAFGCHFLTDLFASGHVRTPRGALAERLGVLVGGLGLSKKMHDEDNQLGLWCTTRAARSRPDRPVWRAYGDGFLHIDAGAKHRTRVQRAVCQSIRELVAARRREEPEELAEGLIPVPLEPGEPPEARAGSFEHDGVPAKQMGPNHHPLCWPVDRDGKERVFLRVGGLTSSRYVDANAPWAGATDYRDLA